jgi:hypothetical protein
MATKGRKNPNPKKTDTAWNKLLDQQRAEHGEKVAAIEAWIDDNNALWEKLSDVQRAQIADIDSMASKTEGHLEVLKQSSTEFLDISREIGDEIRSQTTTNTTLLDLAGGLEKSWGRYNAEVNKGTKQGTKNAAIIMGVVDSTKSMMANLDSIGTLEFVNLNLSRDIAKAKAAGLDEEVENLKLLQKHSDMLKRMHDQISETADLLKQPFSSIDGWIKQIPIFGNLLSKMIPFDKWGDDLAAEFTAKAGEGAKSWFLGATGTEETTPEIEAQQESAEATKENTDGMSENTEALVALKDAISSMEEGQFSGDITKAKAAVPDKEVEKLTQHTEIGRETEALAVIPPTEPVPPAITEATLGGPVAMTVTGPVQMIIEKISDILTPAPTIDKTKEVYPEQEPVPPAITEATLGGPVAMTVTGPVQMMIQKISDILTPEIGAPTIDKTKEVFPERQQEPLLLEAGDLAQEGEQDFYQAGLTDGSIFTHISNWKDIADSIKGSFTGDKGDGVGKGKGGVEGVKAEAEGIDVDVSDNGFPDKEDLGMMDKMKQKAGKLGDKWGKASLGMKGIAVGAAAIGAAMAGWLVSTFKFTRELGFALGELPTTAVFFKDEVTALADEFGTLRDVNNELLLDMWKQKMLHGAAVGDMAKIARIQTNITGMSKEMAIEEQAKWMKEFKKEGLAANKILGDMATNADFIAMGTKGMGDNMKDAAIYAGKMGTTMDELDTVASSLLDYSSSITAEAELQALTGKSINLDKARTLAYEQNYKEMAIEVKDQLGGQHAWSQMQRVEREQIGTLLGLQGKSLANFVTAQAKSNEETKSSTSSWVKWAIAIGGALGVVLGGLAFFTGGLSLAGLKAMLIGGAIGLTAGYAVGAATEAYSMAEAGDVRSEAGGVTQISTAEGGLWNLSDNDETAVGPNVLETMKRGQQPSAPVVNIDMKQVTDALVPEIKHLAALMSQRSDEAKEQSRKQKRATEDSGKSR